MTTTLTNIVAYSLQLGVLALAALIVARLLRLRTPLPALRFWQAILAASVLLPLVQAAAAIEPSEDPPLAFTFLTSTTAIDAIAASGASVTTWLIYLVVIGVAIRLLWLALGLVRLRAIARRAQPTTAFAPLMHALSTSLHTTATVAITDDVETPATVGAWRPLILVPRRVLTLPEAVQRAVLTHELLHVRRRDWLHTVGEELWSALLWFHPAARIITARLSLARETVVDEATILLTRDRRAYAEALLAFAHEEPHLPGVIALIGRRQLSQRISLIAEEETMTRRRLAVSLAVALLVAGTAASAAVTTFPMTRGAVQVTVYEPGSGITLPVVMQEFKPGYTHEAMQKKIEGSVFMDVVVDATGSVSDVAVTRSLDAEYGLDDAAVKTAYLWKFKPGMKDGTAVAVRVVLEMTFRLK